MKYEPAAHHLATIDWLMERPAAAIWLDMGSGKTGATATVIDRLLDEVEISRWLIIGTPRIAEVVWAKELAKWDHLKFLTGDQYYHITSDDLPVARTTVTRKGEEIKILKLTNVRQTKAALYRRPAVVFTVHYDLVPRLAKLFGDDWPFDGVVMDESSMVSEISTARFKALRRVRKSIKRLYQLTGTPAANGIEKVYAQAFLLDGGKRLGRTLTEFRQKFLEPEVVDNRTGRVYRWKCRQDTKEAVYSALKEIVLSIDPGEWIKMAQRRLNTISVRLPPAARKVYDRVERDYIAMLENGGVIEAVNAAVLGNKLLQICNGNVYDADKETHHIHDAKIEALKELIEVSGAPILLAYWFDHDRLAIQKALPYAVDLKDDPNFEENWNAGRIRLGMVQPASAGHGINLQDGGYLACWYGPIHNLEFYLQFNKRLHRPGQKAGEVIIHHLICEDSIEEDVMVRGSEKEDDQDAIMVAVQRRVNRITGKAE